MPQLFACFRSTDANKTIDFLEQIGFRRSLVVPDESRPGVVNHAQLRWRDDGGVMLSTIRDDSSPLDAAAPTFVIYLVVPSEEEVDAVWERALAAGAQESQAPRNESHGGRSCEVRGPDGITLNIGSYPGE